MSSLHCMHDETACSGVMRMSSAGRIYDAANGFLQPVRQHSTAALYKAARRYDDLQVDIFQQAGEGRREHQARRVLYRD
eukprot:scaffold42932_cov28-Prasinocladus_malaysianus.AAC.1